MMKIALIILICLSLHANSQGVEYVDQDTRYLATIEAVSRANYRHQYNSVVMLENYYTANASVRALLEDRLRESYCTDDHYEYSYYGVANTTTQNQTVQFHVNVALQAIRGKFQISQDNPVCQADLTLRPTYKGKVKCIYLVRTDARITMPGALALLDPQITANLTILGVNPLGTTYLTISAHQELVWLIQNDNSVCMQRQIYLTTKVLADTTSIPAQNDPTPIQIS